MCNITRTKEAMEEMLRVVNYSGSEEDMTQAIVEVLQGSHRTLQQSFMRVFAKALAEYAETRTDLRNESAVDFAKRVSQLEHHFPFI